jgi:hypothetical protein
MFSTGRGSTSRPPSVANWIPQSGLLGEAGSSTGGAARLSGGLPLRPWGQTKDEKRAAILLKIFLAQGRPWCDNVTVTAPNEAWLVFFSQHPACRAPGSSGEMTTPFKGGPSWMMGFLASSEGRVNCISFRTAGVLLPIISHLANPQRAETCPALASQGNESDE